MEQAYRLTLRIPQGKQHITNQKNVEHPLKALCFVLLLLLLLLLLLDFDIGSQYVAPADLKLAQ